MSLFTTRLIGAMLVVLLVMALMLPYILLHPVSAPANGFLESAAPMASTIRACLVMLLIGAAAPVAISIMLWSGLSESHPRLGLSLLVIAIINATFQLIENAQWLSLMSLSQAAMGEPGGTAAVSPLLAGAVRASWRWLHYTHISVVVIWLFTLFLTFFWSRAVPRAIATAGLVAAPLHIFGIVLPVFGGYRMFMPDAFGAPLAFAISALALWLMVKGFRSDATLTGTGRPHT